MQNLTLFYLSTCDTSKRIMNEVQVSKYPFKLQDIKTEKITSIQLTQMATLAGGYEPLFSRIAMKYRLLGLNKLHLTEDDYRKFILEEYTFLKRPVFLINCKIFIGNAPATIQELKDVLHNLK